MPASNFRRGKNGNYSTVDLTTGPGITLHTPLGDVTISVRENEIAVLGPGVESEFAKFSDNLIYFKRRKHT